MTSKLSLDISHKTLVGDIASHIRTFHESGRAFRVYHGSTNSTRPQRYDGDAMVDVSALNRVLYVDVEAHTALVEANVPMDRLVAASMCHGLVPPVVMEFPGITVGGGLQGGAGESSSFKWGSFNRTINWFDMILADGTLVRCSPHDHADLYYGSAGAYGSLGVVTQMEITLQLAAKYVELELMPVAGFDGAVEAIKAATAANPDYVDGIMYARDRGLIVLGRLTDHLASPVVHHGRAIDNWFYLGVEGASFGKAPAKRSMLLADYLFRYDRGAFWTGSYAFARFGVPFNRLTRWLLDPLFKTRRMYLALDASGFSQEYVVQDLSLPASKFAEFMRWVDASCPTYPLWLCPLRPDTDSRLQHDYLPTGGIINVGVWGPGPRDHDAFVGLNRAIEAKVTELGGRKWLYAHVYYTEPEFWQVYDLAWYRTLRANYGAGSLPTIYDKTHVKIEAKRPLSAKRGIWRAICGR